MITRENLKDLYPLSPMQEGMLFHALMDQSSAAYIEQICYGLNGPLDVALFQKAWQKLVERHDILRTVFVYDRVKRPLQAVLRKGLLPFHVEDLRCAAPERQRQVIDAYLAADRVRGFDLIRGPLIRVAVWQTGDAQFEVLWTFHHILLDGWSTGILIGELGKTYQALLDRRTLRLPPMFPYSQYIGWLEKRDRQASIAYWRQRLEGYDEVVGIPRCGWPAEDTIYLARERVVQLSETETAALNRTAAALQATLNSLVHTAWGILLGRYNDKTDVVFGSIVSGRPAALAGVESTVGLCINVVPVRVAVDPGETVEQLVRRVQRESLDGQSHHDVLLSDVQPHQTLIDHVVVFESYPLDVGFKDAHRQCHDELHVASVKAHEQTHYDFTLVLTPGDKLTMTVLYNQNAYDPDYVESLLGHLRRILQAVAQTPEAKVSCVPMLSSDEEQRLLLVWNATETLYPKTQCIHALFDEQRRRNPDAVAVVCGEHELTYRELNQRANQLAHYLVSRGMGPEEVVAICMERCLEMLVALLGTLKAGGAYLGLDPSCPPSRTAFIVNDARVRVVLTQQTLAPRFHTSAVKTICLDSTAHMLADQPYANPSCTTTAADLAYVSYTSGSTGKPKGVGVCHQSVVRLVKQTSYVELGPQEVVLQYAPLSFDASTFEIWGPLLNGGRLVLMDHPAPTLEELGAVIRQHRVTTLWLTAGLFHLMVDERIEDLRSVRQLLAGGDVLSPRHVKKALVELDGCKVINGYGPTENTTFTCCHSLTDPNAVGGNVSIGRPIANSQVFILNRRLQPVPVGVAGELYIGGDGLARGYLRRPDLTAASFVPHLFSSAPGARLYRSGDLARYRSDGTIEFLGRIDNQVKLRGFRIEPGEIEAALNEVPGVKESLVLAAREPGAGIRLTAYIATGSVEHAQPPFDPAELRRVLGRSLPDYMIPSSFVWLSELPLTSNGKVDRRALSQQAPAGGQPRFTPPVSAEEKALAAIWCEILGLDRVGVRDNFFELGGHSLRATQVVSRVRKEFRIEMPLRALFESPTIDELARLVIALTPLSASTDDPPALVKRSRRPVPLNTSACAPR